MEPPIDVSTELRAAVIKAVCFKPDITGHTEQFEAIEALLAKERAAIKALLPEKEYNDYFELQKMTPWQRMKARARASSRNKIIDQVTQVIDGREGV